MTTDNSFSTSFVVPQTPDAVFAAINSVGAWWSGTIEGRTTALGDSFSYRYKDLHFSRQLIVAFEPGRKVEWQVTESQLNFLADKSEWTGTTIVFEIAPVAGGTELRFTHRGLRPKIECYDVCSNAWSDLIQGSLKEFIQVGHTELLALDEPTM